MAKRRWAVAYYVHKQIVAGVIVTVHAGVVSAVSKEEAIGIGMTQLLNTYSTEDGYGNHNCVVEEISDGQETE